MPATADRVMNLLYGRNIWAEFGFDARNVHHQGWNGTHQALRRVAFTAPQPIVLDVGVWKGESTITIAKTMRDAKLDGCVIAIDTFLGSPEHWFHQGTMFGRNVGMPDLYRTFLSNVWSHGLQPYVVPMPQTSAAAAHILRGLPLRISGVHIDASHEYADVMRDATDYWSILSAGGVLIGDDYDKGWPGVVRAVDDFGRAIGGLVTIDHPKWLAQKP
jgi:hypothetical protein